MDSKTRIKEYLDSQAENDNAIKATYKPGDESQLKDCMNYIISQARKQAKNGSVMIEDAVVFKWARDFILGDIEQPKEEIKLETKIEKVEEPKAEVETEESKVEVKTETPKAPKKTKEKEYMQIAFDFGEGDENA